MHAAFRVKANFLHVSPGLSKQDPALVSEPNGSPVEISVLRVIFHAIINNEVEVILKLREVVVALRIDALPHCGEVHWVLDVVEVVRHLQETENMRNYFK